MLQKFVCPSSIICCPKMGFCITSRIFAIRIQEWDLDHWMQLYNDLHGLHLLNILIFLLLPTILLSWLLGRAKCTLQDCCFCSTFGHVQAAMLKWHKWQPHSLMCDGGDRGQSWQKGYVANALAHTTFHSPSCFLEAGKRKYCGQLLALTSHPWDQIYLGFLYIV